MNDEIEHELAKCRQAAEEGYALASGKYNEIRQTLFDAANSLAKTDAEQSEVKRIKNTALVDKQKDELNLLTDKVKRISDDLQFLRGHAKEFSIVVYGRTMAGKSTLMEILTHGNGESIGKGGQRTTRDVRDYSWNGLRIWDVPGICAFGGAEDERKALEAAKSADLILFLLTSDAPQPDEAACLAQLKSFGKPVLGVINIKMSFNIEDELDIEDLQNKLADTETIDATIRQFKEFAASHNQDWSDIKFVATHLLAAYQSQDKNPTVFKMSRFAAVEEFILNKVRSDGKFLRIKTFVDSVAVPMSNIILKIYEHSAKSLLESNIWLEKRQQLDKWGKNFSELAKRRFKNLYSELKTDLENTIRDFAENHYEDKHVNENWKRSLRSLNLNGRYQSLLEELAGECQRKRKALSDELRQELTFTFHGNNAQPLELEGTTTWGQYISTAVGVAGVLFPPLILLGILGNIFSESKAEKIRAAKKKLREDLTAPSLEMLDTMHAQAMNIFREEILLKGVLEFYFLLGDYQFMLARLGKSQSDMAAKLFEEFSDLNVKLLEHAIMFKDAEFISTVNKNAQTFGKNLISIANRAQKTFSFLPSFDKNIRIPGEDFLNAASRAKAKVNLFLSVNKVARIPGEKILVVASLAKAKLNFDELSELLGEKILVVIPQENTLRTIQTAFDCEFKFQEYALDFDKKNVKTPKTFSLVPQETIDAANLKLAQQIACLPIITR